MVAVVDEGDAIVEKALQTRRKRNPRISLRPRNNQVDFFLLTDEPYASRYYFPLPGGACGAYGVGINSTDGRRNPDCG